MLLQSEGLVPDILELLSGSNETFIYTGAKDTSAISYYLSQFNVKVPIKTGKCSSVVFYNNGIVYLNDTEKRNDAEVAAIIISKLPPSYWIEQIIK